MIIGNIIYRDDLVNHTKVEYINYVRLNGDNIEDVDDTLPTLIVGWDLFKNYFSHFNENLKTPSILEKEYIKNKKYWEFSFNEKKGDHISGVDLFSRNVPYYYFRENFKYINLDPIFNKIETIDDLKLIAPDTSKSVVYNYKNEMLYILLVDTIYGIDLNMYKYFNINDSEIIEYFKQSTHHNHDDPDGSVYLEHYKSYPNFEELKRYLVVLLSKA